MDIFLADTLEGDYDLRLLAAYVLLDSLRRQNEVLQQRILGQWARFQLLQVAWAV